MISILVNTNYLFNLHNNYYNEFQTTKIIQIIEIPNGNDLYGNQKRSKEKIDFKNISKIIVII